MSNWERLGIEVTNPPNLDELAYNAIGIDLSGFLRGQAELKDALMAECIRNGLYLLFIENHEHVFNLRLRNWVFRKLGSVFPEKDLMLMYKETIKKLKFLGDVIELNEGYLCPGPPRCIQTGSGSCILVSGFPTRAFLNLKGKIIVTRMGRRLEGYSEEELNCLETVVQPLNSYLDFSEADGSQNLLSRILSTSRQQVPIDSAWEQYQYIRGQYGFRSWISYDRSETSSGLAIDYKGMKISLWREKIGQGYWHYWLQVFLGTKKWFHEVNPKYWKRVCLALEHTSGTPRRAIVVIKSSTSEFSLFIDFPPFEALYKWLNAIGGRPAGWKNGQHEWEIPMSGLEQTRKILESSGISLQVKEEGDVI